MQNNFYVFKKFGLRGQKDWGHGILIGVGLGSPKVLFCLDTKAVSVSELEGGLCIHTFR